MYDGAEQGIEKYRGHFKKVEQAIQVRQLNHSRVDSWKRLLSTVNPTARSASGEASFQRRSPYSFLPAVSPLLLLLLHLLLPPLLLLTEFITHRRDAEYTPLNLQLCTCLSRALIRAFVREPLVTLTRRSLSGYIDHFRE